MEQEKVTNPTANFNTKYLINKGIIQKVPTNELIESYWIREGVNSNSVAFYRAWYYNNYYLRQLYRSSKWHYCLRFRTQILPKRCEIGYTVLFSRFDKFIKTKRKSYCKRAAINVVTCFVKNMSRARYHKTYTLKYSRDKNAWSKKNNIYNTSHKLSMELIEMLVEEELLYTYTGLRGNKDNPNISSMLVLTQGLIDTCTGVKSKIPKRMENCLKVKVDNYLVIRENSEGSKKVERSPIRGEVMKAKELERTLTAFNKELEEHEITINDELVQDLYYRAMFNDDLEHGGRLCDSGQIQSKSKKERKTIRMDGSPTISLDFKSLHPSFLFELEGVSLYGRKRPLCL